MVEGQKCLVQCRCVLPQYRQMHDPPFHCFVVFVIIDDGVVRQKIVQCNNCGILHRIVELCKTEIMNGRESSLAITTIADVRAGMRENIVAVLDSNGVDLPTWEMSQFIVENQRWGEHVVLSTETSDGITHGKIMMILGENMVKIEPFTRNEVF